MGPMATTLLYRRSVPNDGLVFADEDEARRVAQINRAIRTARTWAEFRSLMRIRDLCEILTAIGDVCEEQPCASDEFSGEQIPGYSDGDYPTWLQQQMGHIIPMDILQRYGTLKSTSFNGSYWHLPPEREHDIVAALEARGFVVKKAFELEFH